MLTGKDRVGVRSFAPWNTFWNTWNTWNTYFYKFLTLNHISLILRAQTDR